MINKDGGASEIKSESAQIKPESPGYPRRRRAEKLTNDVQKRDHLASFFAPGGEVEWVGKDKKREGMKSQRPIPSGRLYAPPPRPMAGRPVYQLPVAVLIGAALRYACA